MGLGVALRNLFQNIFGKKKVGNNDSQITKEIRMRAKELGISPEDYLKITKGNGSVWDVNNAGYETGIYSGIDESDIEAIRSNLYEKYSKLGVPMDINNITNDSKPTFGLISRSRPVTEAQNVADEQNTEAVNFFQEATAQREKNIFAANQEVTQAEQTAAQNNNAANTQLTKTQTTAENNNTQAVQAQHQTEEETKQENAAAQQEVETTELQTKTNNQQAQQNTVQAQNSNNAAAQAVTRSQEQLNTANQKLQQAQTAADTSENTSPEATARVQQAKQERDKAQEEADKAKSEEQRAKQELDSAQKQEEETKKNGQEQVDKTKQQAESKKAEGEKKVDEAKANTKKVKQQGDENTTEAQNNVAKTKTEGEQTVNSQQNNANQVTQTENNNVEKVQTQVNNTKKQGEMDVNAAQKDTTQQIEDAQKQAANQLQAAGSDSKTAQNMKKAADARYQQEVALGRNTKLQGAEHIMPNGIINDKVSHQEKVNNCWAHSGVNSLASTQNGKALLEENIYRDKEKGVTSVHLKEAENNGMGHNKSGVYTFTDKEIAEGATRFGSGDGDNTAYMLAAEKYLQEKGENRNQANASDFNHSCRMYEIVSGEKYNIIKKSDRINPGISLCEKKFNNMFDYETLRNGIQSGKVSGTLGFGLASGGSHLLSVVGVAPNGNLLVQDPMNDGRTNQRCSRKSDDGRQVIYPFKEYKPVNGAPTYELTKDMYEKYARTLGTYRRRV